MVKYNYERKHFEFLEKCSNKGYTVGQILKEWNFDEFEPTYRSVSCRLRSVQLYGIDRCLNTKGNFTKKKKAWTEEEEKHLILANELCNSIEHDAVSLFIDVFPERTYNAARVRMAAMTATGQLQRKSPKAVSGKDQTDRLLKVGLKIIGDPVVKELGYVEVECVAFGHRNRVRVDSTGCKTCHQVGQLPLSQLKNHELGQVPALVYLVQFEDGILKTGHTEDGTIQRGKKWPPFKILKEINTTKFHARRIETETQNQVKRLPMYEPLQGNGGTECFEEKYLEKLLDILSKEENSLLHEKNNT